MSYEKLLLTAREQGEIRRQQKGLGNAAKPFTMEEIFDLPVGFDDRGGFNCRHDWVVV